MQGLGRVGRETRETGVWNEAEPPNRQVNGKRNEVSGQERGGGIGFYCGARVSSGDWG